MNKFAACFVVTALLTATPLVELGAEENGPVPDKVLQHLKKLVGTWEMTGTVAAGEAKSTITVTWAPGKHMLLFNSTWSDPEGKSLGSGLFGWDAVDERIHMSEFWDDGYYHHRHFKIVSDKVWEGEEFEGATGDGKRIRAKARVEFQGPDHFTFKLTDATRDGEASPGADLVFRRKQ